MLIHEKPGIYVMHAVVIFKFDAFVNMLCTMDRVLMKQLAEKLILVDYNVLIGSINSASTNRCGQVSTSSSSSFHRLKLMNN